MFNHPQSCRGSTHTHHRMVTRSQDTCSDTPRRSRGARTVKRPQLAGATSQDRSASTVTLEENQLCERDGRQNGSREQ